MKIQYHHLISILLWLLVSALNSFGQDFSNASNLRCKKLAWTDQRFILDSLTIAESTIEIRTNNDPVTSTLSFDYFIKSNEIQLISKGVTPPDSIEICYRVFPYLFSRNTRLRERIETDAGFIFRLPDRQKELALKDLTRDGFLKATGIDELTPTTNLERNGSLTRGVSFGSAQDVFVNSALNLQLNGQLTEDIAIEATLSDQQVPYQPEGNTQQLQEFDRVFISLQHKKGRLNAGDLTFQNQSSSQFLKYYKNVQGAQLSLNLGDTSAFHTNTKVGVAVAKGQFISQNIEPLEGVAGPYRLTGPRNERFIVIMANSEKVYLDGELLERGFNLDYIIDYNTAEVTFTNRVLITRFSRIRVDFEYAVQNYARTIIQADQSFSAKKWKASFHLYQEKDSRNNSLLFELDDTDKALLASVGDSLENAFSETAVSVEEFTPNQILYTRKDTIVNGVANQVFVRAKEGDSPLFRVAFSEVTSGRGDYIATQPDANGRVFEWVSPNSTIIQRRYAPIRVLPAPNKREMMAGIVEYKISKNTKVFGEIALSNQDQNLFSEIDQNDNRGFATKVGLEISDKPIKKWQGTKLNARLSYEYDEKNFRPIDRFRYVEFDRDWSITDTFPTPDQIVMGAVQLTKDQNNNLEYNITLRNRVDAAKGIQQRLKFTKELSRFRIKSNIFNMNSTGRTNSSEWFRLKSNFSYRGKRIIPGYLYQLDRNKVLNANKDSVVSTAMNFESHQWYLQNADSTAVQFKLSFENRNDRSPLMGELQNFTKAQTINFAVQHSGEQNQLAAFFTYRTLEQQQIAGNPIEETITGRLDWQATFFNTAIQSEVSFVSNSGRELKREFVYLAVDPGTGTHTWRDENGDGVQQLGEFYEAMNPDERNFAKFFTPTNEYIPAFNTQIVHRLKVSAPRKWQKEKGVKKLMSKFSYSSSLQFQQKSSRSELKYRLLPFLFRVEETDLLGGRNSWRSEFFFNKRSPKFGVELRNLYNQRKNLLTNGFERNNSWSHLLAFRITAKKKITYRLELINERSSVNSDLLNNRDLNVLTLGVSPQITFLTSRKFRLSSIFSYKQKADRNGSQENNQSNLSSLKLQTRWNQGVSNLITGALNFTLVNYNGEINTARGYALLEALQPGNNLQWKLNWSKRLKGGLQLTVSYTGRKPEGSPVVHLGRMQATALF